MDLTTILIVLPIFFVLYKAVGMFLDSQPAKRWGAPNKLRERPKASENALREFTQLSSKMGFNKFLLRSKLFSERLELLLLRSGYPFGWKAEDLLFTKEIGAVGLLALFAYGSPDQPTLWIAGLALGFWMPDMYLNSKAKNRRAEIQRLLPGFVDLAALALESGLDLMAAIDRILEKMKPSSLKEELSMLLQENRLGTPRKAALEHLAYRVYLPDVQSLTSIIIQSEELGTSLATVLRNYAEDMRNRRILRAEEIAGKAPVKMLMPMMIFFFPIVFIIIFGPLAMNFAANYK